jgi:hypothetical protein
MIDEMGMRSSSRDGARFPCANFIVTEGETCGRWHLRRIRERVANKVNSNMIELYANEPQQAESVAHQPVP